MQTTNFSVLSMTNFIGDELAKCMDKISFRFKVKDSLDPEDYWESKPTVETFTYDDLDENGYPTHMPSVLVQPISEENGTCHFVVFVCVCAGAIQEIEKTVEVEGKKGVYKHIDSPDYTSFNAKRDLYKTALLLTEQVALALKRISNTNAALSNIQTSFPSPLLPDFPFCSGVVEFDARLSQTTAKINTKLASLL